MQWVNSMYSTVFISLLVYICFIIALSSENIYGEMGISQYGLLVENLNIRIIIVGGWANIYWLLIWLLVGKKYAENHLYNSTCTGKVGHLAKSQLNLAS